jgi:hypothetical protein
MSEKFATVINCMDGRTQIPVMAYLKNKFNVDYIDTITEPGPIKYLAENTDKQVVESIKARLKISIEKHGSKALGVVAHHGCAGNPVDRLEQMEQLEKAVELIKSWGFDLEISKMWIDENWTVHED